jgi:hypothetical protein
VLLDISHVHIWNRGNHAETERTCLELLSTTDVRGMHLSHNDGRRDNHELIPLGMWFDSMITSWAVDKVVTYESLPQAFGKFERLDNRRNRWADAAMREGRV